MGELKNKQWTATEKEDDKKHWLEDYNLRSGTLEKLEQSSASSRR